MSAMPAPWALGRLFCTFLTVVDPGAKTAHCASCPECVKRWISVSEKTPEESDRFHTPGQNRP